QLEIGVLEQVRIHRADAKPAVLDVLPQLGVVVDRVPRKVQGHRAGGAGEPVHLGGVVDALEDVSRAARLREGREAGSRIAIPPGRRLDDELAEAGEDVGLWW